MTISKAVQITVLLLEISIYAAHGACAQEKREISLLLDPREEYAPVVCFSADGKKVIYASRRLRTGELDAVTGKIVSQRKLDEPALLKGLVPWEIRLFDHGNRILTSDVKIWDRNLGDLKLTLPQKGTLSSVDISADGKSLVVANAKPGAATYFRVTTPETQTALSPSGVRSVKMSSDSKLVAEGHGDGTVRVWEAASGKKILDLEPIEKRQIKPLAFSADNNLLAVGSVSGHMRLWNFKENKDVLVKCFEDTAPYSFAFSPNGKTFAVGTFHGDIFVWTIDQDNKLAHTLTGHDWAVHSISFSPDGDWLVSGSYDGTVGIWSVKSGAKRWKSIIMK